MFRLNTCILILGKVFKKNIKKESNIKSSHTNGFAQILFGFYLVTTSKNYFRNFFNDHIRKFLNDLEVLRLLI